jgi:hypothetical protein
MHCQVLCGIAASVTLFAQSVSLSGVVSDARGQRLPVVTVTAIPESGGPLRSATSDSNGLYRIESLPDGIYRVDFERRGFEVIRRNHVDVRRSSPARVDVELPLRPLCECVTPEVPSPWAQRAGQVVDTAGRPLPHARIELVGREAAFSDHQGRFLLRMPVNETWVIAASDTGFRRVTQDVSGADGASVALSLEYRSTASAPDLERLGGCECQTFLLPYDVPEIVRRGPEVSPLRGFRRADALVSSGGP